MLEIDGSHLLGSGSIVRHAVAYAAATGTPVRVVNARARRPKPGLRRQHAKAVEAVRDLVGGTIEGVTVGSREFVFRPGDASPRGSFRWDIGSAGSTTALALAVLPVLASRRRGAVDLEVRGGLFQDFAPSVFHLQHVVAPLLEAMGFPVKFVVTRPGYVPRGEGVLGVSVPDGPVGLTPLVVGQRGELERVWGISLASHLDERQVSGRMAEAARKVLARAGVSATIEERSDDRAAQPGAAFGLFAQFSDGCRLGADGAGARGRRAEDIGRAVARELLDGIGGDATIDRFASDQVMPFAALAGGTSTFRAAEITEHVATAAWLAERFVGAAVRLDDDGTVSIS